MKIHYVSFKGLPKKDFSLLCHFTQNLIQNGVLIGTRKYIWYFTIVRSFNSENYVRTKFFQTFMKRIRPCSKKLGI